MSLPLQHTVYSLLLLCFITSCKNKKVNDPDNLKRGDRIEIKGDQGFIVSVGNDTTAYYTEYVRAEKLLEEHKIDSAIKVYKQLCIVETYQLRPYALTSLGSAYLQTNQLQKAVESYQRSIKINSNSPENYVGLGSVYYRLEDYKRAIKYYQIAKGINRNYSDSYWGLAIAYDMIDDRKNARENARKFLELQPNSNYGEFQLWKIFRRNSL